MSAATEKRFSLTLRIGGYRRYTSAVDTSLPDAFSRQSGRVLELYDCPILSSNFKGEEQPARGDEIGLWVHEVDPSQQVIGSFTTLDDLRLSLPPITFAEFWAASAAADGAARDVHISFKTDETEFYRITHIKLTEYLPPVVDWNPKSRSHYLVRVHPVVAEMREIQKKLAGSWRGLVTAFFVVAAFVLVTDLIGAVIRVLWKSVHP